MTLTIYSASSLSSGLAAIRELDGRHTRVLRLSRKKRGTSLERYLSYWLKKHKPLFDVFVEYERVMEEFQRYETAGLIIEDLSDNPYEKIKSYLSAIERFEDTFKTYERKKRNLPSVLTELAVHPEVLKQLEALKTELGDELYMRMQEVGLHKIKQALILEKGDYLDKAGALKKADAKMRRMEELEREEAINKLKEMFAEAKDVKERYNELFYKNGIPMSNDGKEFLSLVSQLISKVGETASQYLLPEYFENARKHGTLLEVIAKRDLDHAKLVEAQTNFDYLAQVDTTELVKCLNAYMQTGLMASYVRNSSGATRLIKELFRAELANDQVCAALRTCKQFRDLSAAIDGNELYTYLKNVVSSMTDCKQVLQSLFNLRQYTIQKLPSLPKEKEAVLGWVPAAIAYEPLKQEFNEKGSKLVKSLGWDVYSEENISSSIERARSFLLNTATLPLPSSKELRIAKQEVESIKKEIEALNAEGVLARVLGANPFERIDELYKLNKLFEILRQGELPEEHVATLMEEGNLAQIAVIESLKENIFEQRRAILRMQTDIGDYFGLPKLKEGFMTVRLAVQELLTASEQIKALATKRTALEVTLDSANFSELALYPEREELYQKIKGKGLSADLVSQLLSENISPIVEKIAGVVLILNHEIAKEAVNGEIVEILDKQAAPAPAEGEAKLNPEDLLNALDLSIKEVVLAPAELQPNVPLSSLDNIFDESFLDGPLVINVPESVPQKPLIARASDIDALFENAELGTELNETHPGPGDLTADDSLEASVPESKSTIPSSPEALFGEGSEEEPKVEKPSAVKKDDRVSKYLSKYNSHKDVIKDWKSGSRGTR